MRILNFKDSNAKTTTVAAEAQSSREEFQVKHNSVSQSDSGRWTGRQKEAVRLPFIVQYSFF